MIFCGKDFSKGLITYKNKEESRYITLKVRKLKVVATVSISEIK